MRRGMFWVALILAVGLIIVPMSANACQKCSGKEQKITLKDKFCKKAKFALQHKEELGLTDDQYQKIKALKVKTKKDLIMKKAEIEVIVVDIKSELYNDPINVKAINKLIDTKYDIKKQKANALVQAIADLKNILTKEQKAKMKAVFHKKYGSQCGKGGSGSQGSGKFCPITGKPLCSSAPAEAKGSN